MGKSLTLTACMHTDNTLNAILIAADVQRKISGTADVPLVMPKPHFKPHLLLCVPGYEATIQNTQVGLGTRIVGRVHNSA